MISGRRAWLLGGLGLLARPALAEPNAAAWDIDALMATLGKVRSGSARFVERKYLQIAKVPLESSGTLRFAPDLLVRQTLLPQPGLVSIEGDRLTVERAGAARQEVSLGDAPEIAALVSGLRATLSGDRATLERYFLLSLAGDAAGWQLALTPRAARVRGMVASIRIDGVGSRLTRVDTQEADGDHTEMTIETSTEPGP